MQLDLFKKVENQVNEQKLDEIVDTVRAKYGFGSLVHASSLMIGATAIKRNSTLFGGHASGRNEKDVKQIQ